MHAEWFDWFFIAFLTLFVPASAAKSYQQILPRLQAHETGIREAVYYSSILSQWIFVAVLCLWWWYQERDFNVLSLGLPRFTLVNLLWFCVIVFYAVVVILYTRHIVDNPEKHKSWFQRLQRSPGIDITPAHRRQLPVWWLVSITAGFCEELIYRAFVLWLLSLYLSPIPALLLMSLLFGLGHRYQGSDGILMTALLGLLMGTIYITTDTLWLAVLAHALIDASHGWAAYRIYHNYVALDESMEDSFEC